MTQNYSRAAGIENGIEEPAIFTDRIPFFTFVILNF